MRFSKKSLAEMDLPSESMSPAPFWPPDLDALVAAPLQHRLLMENARVRVLVSLENVGLLDLHIISVELKPS